METLDHRTDPSKLWRTIKTIDGKSPPKGDIQVSSPKQIANYFNRQFTTSKIGRHTSSRETRIVSREIKRKSLMSAVTFTTDQVTKGISNCSNTKAFGPDKLSIFHLKRICYADDITVWASGVEITELEHKVNTYLTEMSQFLRGNSLLISAPKSSVTLFTPDPAQANTRPKIKIADSEIPLVRSPKLLGVGVYLDTFFSFNKHCVQVANRVSKRNNVLKALAGTNWGQQKETLLMTYKALGRSIANYAAPVWSINASETNIGKIQRTQNEALRIITGSHKMSSIDHIHSETKMLQVEDHLNLLSAQYLVQCLDTENVCHHITTASKQQERHNPDTSHLICQYSNRQHEG